MVKNSCNCKNENILPGVSSFYLFRRYNSKLTTQYRNPRLSIINNMANSENDKTIRVSNTPWRVPYNHYRKTHSCENNISENECQTNEEIVKDVVECNDDNGNLIECDSGKTPSTRLVNKNGLKITNDGGNYKNYLYKRGKLFSQNIKGLLQENRDLAGGVHDPQGLNLYKIGDVNGTVLNKNSGTKKDSCGINITTIRNKNKFSSSNPPPYIKIPTAVKKFSNPKFGTSSSVSSRNRLQQLKYNTKIASQFGNCVNGEICSKYGLTTKNVAAPMLFQFSIGNSSQTRTICRSKNGSKLSCS